MRNIDEYPVSAGLAARTLAAAREARRKRWSIAGAVSSMALVTAVAAGILFLPGLWQKANIAAPTQAPTATMAAAAPEATGEGEGQPQDLTGLTCNAVPLVGGGEAFRDIGKDGSFNLLVEPGKLDETLEQFGLRADTRNSQAAGQLDKLRGSARAFRLVLVKHPSCSPRMNAIGLYLKEGTAQFQFTDCVDFPLTLYTGLNEAIGEFGFLVEIPEEAAGLPFTSGLVQWNDISTTKKLEIMVERILTYTKSTAAEGAEALLQQSTLETEAIARMGQEAAEWLKTRYEALYAGGGLPHELEVLALLRERAEAYASFLNPHDTGSSSPPLDDNSAIQNALANDLAMHILSGDGEKARNSHTQIYSSFLIKEPYDGNNIILAVLASTMEGEGKPSKPELFIVDAVYEKTESASGTVWKRQSWTITKKDRLDQDEYPMLQYRGGDTVLLFLYGQLNEKMGDFIDEPFQLALKDDEAKPVKLLDKSGTLRWYRLSLWAQLEQNAGCSNIDRGVMDYPEASGMIDRLAGLAGGEWEAIDDNRAEDEVHRPNEAGLHNVMLELHLADERGLWAYNYQFNVHKKNVVLWRTLTTADGRGGQSEHFLCNDSELYVDMINALQVDMDVSDLLIDDKPKFTLPTDREELRQLLILVQDMPGGIFAIRPSILYHDGAGGFTREDLAQVKTKAKVLAWAEALGKFLNYMRDDYQESVMQIDALPGAMAATGEAGQPALLRWDFDMAAQEGEATLTIHANPQTRQVWTETTYRLYGSTRIGKRYMATQEGDDRLYLLLTKLTFGKEIRKIADLP